MNRLPHPPPPPDESAAVVAVAELSIGGGATAIVGVPVGKAPSAGWPKPPQSSAQFCQTGIFLSQYFFVK